MSYGMMEALLVQKIADLRTSESDFARSLQETTVSGDWNTAFRRIHTQMSEVEQLMALMDAAPAETIAVLLPVDASRQIASSVWM